MGLISYALKKDKEFERLIESMKNFYSDPTEKSAPPHIFPLLAEFHGHFLLYLGMKDQIFLSRLVRKKKVSKKNHFFFLEDLHSKMLKNFLQYFKEMQNSTFSNYNLKQKWILNMLTGLKKKLMEEIQELESLHEKRSF
ncbi:hypothetical protein [Candidatus Lokiarchaeum ossiferum]|uniref:hypothetical protein n=1 Tax=Candidatus Lokiarchaeum ossiferum TaxID=2951803 RepID=UPI00352C82FB